MEDPGHQAKEDAIYGGDVPEEAHMKSDFDHPVDTKQVTETKSKDSESMKKRLYEIEEEASALREIQVNVEKQIGTSPGNKGRMIHDEVRKNKRRREQGKEKATWNDYLTEAFIMISAEQCRLGFRPSRTLNKIGYKNLIREFSVVTGKKWERMQFKNKWDSLRKEWNVWKEVSVRESGLGCSHKRHIIDESEEWWERKIKENPLAAKFKTRPPLLEERQSEMFDGDNVHESFATSGNRFTLCLASLTSNSGNEGNDRENTGVCTTSATSIVGEGRFTSLEDPSPSRQPKKTTFATTMLNNMRDMMAILKESNALMLNTKEIGNWEECIEALDKIPGLSESPLYIQVVEKFENPQKRGAFLALRTLEHRLAYLKRLMERTS